MASLIRQLTLLGFLVWLGGCRGATSGGNVNTDIAANLDEYEIEQVGIMGFANMSGEPEAEVLAEYVTDALRATKRCQIIGMRELHSDVVDGSIRGDFDELTKMWKKKREVSEPIIRNILTATGRDALILMEITNWKMVKLNPLQKGTSQTTVGLKLNMYASDGKLVWSAGIEEIQHSLPYEPKSADTTSMDRDFHSTSWGKVPDPPAIDEVARITATKVADAFPAFSESS